MSKMEKVNLGRKVEDEGDDVVWSSLSIEKRTTKTKKPAKTWV